MVQKLGVEKMEESGHSVKRLLLVSSRARNLYKIHGSVKDDEVILVQYKYETCSLDEILGLVIEALGTQKVNSIGFIMHGIESELYISAVGEKVLSLHSIREQLSIREFFTAFVSSYLDTAVPGARLDFFATLFKLDGDGGLICKEMEMLFRVSVGISNHLFGNEIKLKLLNTSLLNSDKELTAGDLYFHTDKMKTSNQKTATPRPRSYNKAAFEKIRTVGKGAFGTAVLYRRKDNDTMVVIKEINMHDLTGSERQLALNEVKVLSVFDHPNIITYFESYEDDGVLKIEMEYADGGNMAENLAQRDQPLDEREILILFHQIVSAIRHMHDHNILHRDLKTANILLTKGGIIKVGDFGISKMMTTRAKGANTVVGTPYYISPEMCEGKMYDEKSDVWALGCILYEMACLQKTFEGSNLPALVNKIMKGQFAPVKGNYSHGLKQLIRDLLQRDPEFRPTAGEIMHERLPELLAHFSGELGDEVDEEMMSAIENVKQREKCGSFRRMKPNEIFSFFDMLPYSAVKNTRSVVYNIRTFESSISLNPIPLPPKSKVIQLAVSGTHMIALTNELMVYTWGDGRRGQLGHGILETWRARPECVSPLKGKSITRVCAGEGFSVFASNSGIIMTCGDGTAGCLGHGDWNCASRPKLIEALLSVDVSAIACGPSHVVVVGGEGEVYSWGRGINGRLGLGQEDDCCVPTQVTVPNDVNIRNVKCGRDNTMFITDNGSALACGNNQYNKLALNEHSGFFRNLFMKTDVDKVSTPAPIKSLSGFHVVDISMGPNHTAVLVEPGHVITFGRNSEGQLGRGHTRSSNSPNVVKNMVDKTTLMLECGETFTVVGTIENAVYFWGTRYVMCAPTRPPTQDTARAFTASNELPNAVFNHALDNINYKMVQNSAQQRGENGFTLIKEEDDDDKLDAASSRDGSASLNLVPSPRPLLDHRPSKSGLPSSTGPRMKDVLLHPQEILALYASPAQISKGETVNLSSIRCQGQNIFVVVDTTAPLPSHGRRRVRPPLTSRDGREAESNSSAPPAVYESTSEKNETLLNLTQRPEPEGQSPSKELDTMGPVPNWLKEELENSELPWPGGNEGSGQDTDKQPQVKNVDGFSVVAGRSAVERGSNSAPHAVNQTRTPNELKQELQRLRRAKSAAENRLSLMDDEFREKQEELQKQAEANALERERVLREEIDRLHQELSKQTASYHDYSVQIEKVQTELQVQQPATSRLCVVQ